MASHHPLLLHQTLKASEAAIMRVQHELHQGRHHAAQVSVVFFCKRWKKQQTPQSKKEEAFTKEQQALTPHIDEGLIK